MSDILDELQWRGLVAQTTDESALRTGTRRRADHGVLRVRPDGAQRCTSATSCSSSCCATSSGPGTGCICLVGGLDRPDRRPEADRRAGARRPRSRRREWVARIQQQVRAVPATSTATTRRSIVNNLDWTAPLSALDFLRDVGKHFRVNQMVKKEAIAARLDSDEGISYTEFSYQLLQGLDYLQLYRDYGCTLQTGRQRPVGQPHRRVRPDPPGRGGVGAPADHPAAHRRPTARSSARPSRQRDLAGRRHDQPVRLLPVLAQRRGRLGGRLPQGLHRPRPGGDRRARAPGGASEPFRRAAQKTLAADVTTLVHGAAATAAVQAASEALFGKGDLARRWTRGPWRDATAELPGARCPSGMRVVDALVAVGLVGVAQRRPAGDRRGRGLGQQRQGDRPGGAPGGGGLPARPGGRCSAAGASRSRRAGAPAEAAGQPRGGSSLRAMGPLRCLGATAGPQAADLRICLLRGASTLLFSSSARQGGTDTTAAGAQAQPKQAGPAG